MAYFTGAFVAFGSWGGMEFGYNKSINPVD
jgi:hypothetical protein